MNQSTNASPCGINMMILHNKYFWKTSFGSVNLGYSFTGHIPQWALQMLWSVPIKPNLFNKIALVISILVFLYWKYIIIDKLMLL